MKNLIHLIIPLVITLACNQSGKDCCVSIETHVDILYVDSTGNSLIDGSPEYPAENIRIYYKNGEEYEYIFQGNLDQPNMHYVLESSGHKILRIFASNYYEGNFSETLVELNEQTTDTLLCEFDLGTNYEICTKVWHNGTEMPGRYFEIVK